MLFFYCKSPNVKILEFVNTPSLDLVLPLDENNTIDLFTLVYSNYGVSSEDFTSHIASTLKLSNENHPILHEKLGAIRLKLEKPVLEYEQIRIEFSMPEPVQISSTIVIEKVVQHGTIYSNSVQLIGVFSINNWKIPICIEYKSNSAFRQLKNPKISIINQSANEQDGDNTYIELLNSCDMPPEQVLSLLSPILNENILQIFIQVKDNIIIDKSIQRPTNYKLFGYTFALELPNCYQFELNSKRFYNIQLSSSMDASVEPKSDDCKSGSCNHYSNYNSNNAFIQYIYRINSIYLRNLKRHHYQHLFCHSLFDEIPYLNNKSLQLESSIELKRSSEAVQQQQQNPQLVYKEQLLNLKFKFTLNEVYELPFLKNGIYCNFELVLNTCTTPPVLQVPPRLSFVISNNTASNFLSNILVSHTAIEDTYKYNFLNFNTRICSSYSKNEHSKTFNVLEVHVDNGVGVLKEYDKYWNLIKKEQKHLTVRNEEALKSSPFVIGTVMLQNKEFRDFKIETLDSSSDNHKSNNNDAAPASNHLLCKRVDLEWQFPREYSIQQVCNEIYNVYSFKNSLNKLLPLVEQLVTVPVDSTPFSLSLGLIPYTRIQFPRGSLVHLGQAVFYMPSCRTRDLKLMAYFYPSIQAFKSNSIVKSSKHDLKMPSVQLFNQFSISNALVKDLVHAKATLLNTCKEIEPLVHEMSIIKNRMPAIRGNKLNEVRTLLLAKTLKFPFLKNKIAVRMNSELAADLSHVRVTLVKMSVKYNVKSLASDESSSESSFSSASSLSSSSDSDKDYDKKKKVTEPWYQVPIMVTVSNHLILVLAMFSVPQEITNELKLQALLQPQEKWKITGQFTFWDKVFKVVVAKGVKKHPIVEFSLQVLTGQACVSLTNDTCTVATRRYQVQQVDEEDLNMSEYVKTITGNQKFVEKLQNSMVKKDVVVAFSQ